MMAVCAQGVRRMLAGQAARRKERALLWESKAGNAKPASVSLGAMRLPNDSVRPLTGDYVSHEMTT